MPANDVEIVSQCALTSWVSVRVAPSALSSLDTSMLVPSDGGVVAQAVNEIANVNRMLRMFTSSLLMAQRAQATAMPHCIMRNSFESLPAVVATPMATATRVCAGSKAV